MKLRTLTYLISTGLLSVCLGLVITSQGGLNLLNTPFQQVSHYDDLLETFRNRIEAPVQNYLSTGNSLELSRAQDGLTQISDSMLLDPEDPAKSSLFSTLEALTSYMTTEFLAAGKLAGDPKGLLLQNERETRQELSSLGDYVDQAEAMHASGSTQWAKQLRVLLEQLHHRTLLRERYLDNGQQLLRAELSRVNQEMKDAATDLDNLPLLGVMSEPSGSDLLFGRTTSSSDIGEDLRSNLQSLINRYDGEITRTQANLERVANSKAVLERHLVEVGQAIESAQQEAQRHFTSAFSNLRYLLYGAAGMTLAMGLVAILTLLRIAATVHNLQPVLYRLASGDLTSFERPAARLKEVDHLWKSIQSVQVSMRALVGELARSVALAEQQSRSVDEKLVTVQTRAEAQISRCEEVTASVEEMHLSFREVADHAQQVSEASRAAEQAVHLGSSTIAQSLDGTERMVEGVIGANRLIDQLSQEMAQINVILSIIGEISDQTNLLALNAAIEAARAGDHGRGFAVVATEVRTLSLRTAESTEEIRSVLSKLETLTAKASLVMTEQQSLASSARSHSEAANTALSEIVAATVQIHGMSVQIAAATEQQATVSQSISRKMAEIRDTSIATESAVMTVQQLQQDVISSNEQLRANILRFQTEVNEAL